jgi:hypothetical protein
VYRLVADSATMEQVGALPVEALHAYAELLTTLEVSPWSGRPQHPANPDGAVRRWEFGPGAAGHLVYLIDEQAREVHLLLVQWLG